MSHYPIQFTTTMLLEAKTQEDAIGQAEIYIATLASITPSTALKGGKEHKTSKPVPLTRMEADKHFDARRVDVHIGDADDSKV